MEAVTVDVEVKQPAELLWMVHVKELELTSPASNPGRYTKVLYLEGPPFAPGGVFKICYHEEFGHYEYVKFVWDAIDHDNYYFKITAIDGGFLTKHFEALSYEYRILPGKEPDSSIMSWRIEFKDKNKHECHEILKQEVLKTCSIISAHAETMKDWCN
ncbi:hypothetical protein KP509_14G088600 [Ceratopteris richardii]|uniref:Bet v I/Major latex protein domain-containing protein n=1 Tax=Ceratopteris richardii TaxID=49495 RepID=A0A8T2TBT2_CERRI|nr:hypothetical protein KP509_14G088600 [Ceratopteris richardii]